MCIVIDANSLSKVFNDDDAQHHNFKPVFDWIHTGKGKIVYGGSVYNKELSKMFNYLKLVRRYKDVGKAIEINKDEIDLQEIEVKKLEKNNDFDDHHIIAIIRVSKCRLICTADTRAIPFFAKKSLYGVINKPKIYTKSNNSKLLCDSNIANCCKPCSRTTNAQLAIINNL